MSVFFGYHMPNFTFAGVRNKDLFDHIGSLARAAEDAGFGMVTVMDHFYQIGGVGPDTEPMLEAYSTLAALATRTKKVRLGALVTGVTYRNPALLAKTVTTLDVISKGRAMLGIGAAWNEAEHQGYGFEFPPIRERMDRLDEALAICHAMFTQERPSFEGRFYTIDRALNSPRPIQAGGPPILVGGGGEQRTLKIAARHADMTHWFAASVEVLRHKTEVLQRHCEAEGRDPSTITRTIGAPFLLVEHQSQAEAALGRLTPERRAMTRAVTPAQGAEIIRPYVDAGFKGFTFGNTAVPDVESIGLVGELIRLVS
ncbi:MAG TPA: LLM class F420-dependent oxidoreductase [Candidatus Saccharimonadales bacterium]|nr:LLM class F420-dependent oxidoreductase [Candidatus Saccharimonadales bacterium]